jgi:TrmH family RNA methyltransferase
MNRTLGGISLRLRPLAWYKKLSTNKGRCEAGAFLVEGERAIKQIAASHPDHILEIVTTKEPPPSYRNYSLHIVTDSQFRSICHSKTPQGTMALVRLPFKAYSHNLPDHTGNKVLLLEDIQDPGNVGTLIRTAAAFDFSGVILTEKCADPFSPKCVQSTAGSVLSVWIRRTPRYLELVEMLIKKGYIFLAADLSGTDDPSILVSLDKLLLGLGNEASGISEPLRNVSHYRLKIPIIREKAESLNVGVCGAICMYLSSQN